MISDRLKAKIMAHEGFVGHAYQDHLGYWTIGYGLLIDERRGGGITEDEAEYLLDNRMKTCWNDLKTIDAFNGLDEVRQAALMNMRYQLGGDGIRGFRKMWAALEDRDYERAADEALDSKWAKQTPQRALTMAAQIRTGASRD